MSEVPQYISSTFELVTINFEDVVNFEEG